MGNLKNNYKPIRHTSVSITEEYFGVFKEAAELSKKDWRFSKDNADIKNPNLSKMSQVIRLMVKNYVKIRRLENKTGKKFKINAKEISDNDATNNAENSQENESSY